MMLLAVLSPEARCEWKLQDWEVALISTVSIAVIYHVLCSWAHIFSGHFPNEHGLAGCPHDVEQYCCKVLSWPSGVSVLRLATHQHHLRFDGPFPREPGLASS